MERPKVGVQVVLFKGDKILLGKRKNCLDAGTWACPGGHLELGETPEACAKRELKEETGMDALRVESGPWSSDLIESIHYVMLFLIVEEFLGEPKLQEPDKSEGWEWVDIRTLKEPLFTPIASLIQKHGSLKAALRTPQPERMFCGVRGLS